jgi:hypothetical protein
MAGENTGTLRRAVDALSELRSVKAAYLGG